MKRASYREGVDWIAQNDNAGEGDDTDVIAGYISTLLLADLFGVEPGQAAVDINNRRAKLGLPYGSIVSFL